jgi:hypothetical protein
MEADCVQETGFQPKDRNNFEDNEREGITRVWGGESRTCLSDDPIAESWDEKGVVRRWNGDERKR